MLSSQEAAGMAFASTSRTFNVDHMSRDAVAGKIVQSLIEVSNGITAERIFFVGADESSRSAIQKKAEESLSIALGGTSRWAVGCYWIQYEPVVLLMLSTRRYHSYQSTYSGLMEKLQALEKASPSAEDLSGLAHELDDRSLQHIFPGKADEIMRRLSNIAEGDSLLLAALAAEILTNQGRPSVPIQAIIRSQVNAGNSVDLSGTVKHVAATFEKRINVDDYNFFELVHPAYFRQTVALAGLIGKFVNSSSANAIDVGPGPGTNLLAFQDLMPEHKVLAIEPSDVAFHYLQVHFKENANIRCLQEDFLKVAVEPETMDYIMSTGASHHFNTNDFLQRSVEWLRPQGYWFIADEMISPFQTRAERKLNLLRHHLSYMVPLCFPWPSDKDDVRNAAEQTFVDDYNNVVPYAKYYAEIGDLESAETLCRKLLDQTVSYKLTTKVSDPLLAFWRLQHLELQALVAGLDYEVEQKTYPEHFKKMAEGAGLTCIAHERVYGTVGRSDGDAGTHVMVFQKA